MVCQSLPYVFFWKNALYLRYNAVVLTVIFAGCIGILLVYLKSTYLLLTPNETSYEAKDYLVLKQNYFPANEYDLIYYAPSSGAANEIMDSVREELEIIQERYRAFDNVAEMRLLIEQNCKGTCFAVAFEKVPERSSDDSANLSYAISSNQLRISPKKRYVNDERVSESKDIDDYIRAGFLTLQYTIDQQYMKWQGLNSAYELELSTLPVINIKHMDSNRFIYFGTLFSILFCVLLLSTYLVPLIEEKQDGLKEFLTLATPMSFLNGLTFFSIRFLLYVCFLITILVSAQIYHSLGLAHFSYVFVLFLCYMLATMSYGYLISVCFNTVFYGKVGGLFLFIIPYIFYFVEGGVSNVAFYLFSTKAFMEGLDVMQTFTNKHRTFTSSELFVQIKDDSFSIFSVYIMLLIQTLGYALLYNYLACVFPGPGGLKKPFLFFLNPKFYKKRQRNEYTTGARGTDAIIIENLVKKFKTYKNEILISDHLNMAIKNKQITVLLGHNGAGKTTTLNMIMGLLPKDSGKIVVCSERDVASYRHLIGFCPQHSVFMNYMTCKQHIIFFAQLRGMTYRESNKIAHTLLEQLHLADKAYEYGKNLSGGMKRRLSLGIALAGETKVVILDEPSSGLDIESRRELWDILLKLRKTKAVLVTTHYMEEAEVLGDTICILANGRLQRTGTPLELKRQIGCGYRLKLLTRETGYRQIETFQLIKQYIKNAKVLNVVHPTVYISLPYAFQANFHDMLEQLERNRNHLGIESISITDTSLEDVFLNCAAENDQVDSPESKRVKSERIPYERLNGSLNISWPQQFYALSYKKCTFLMNEWFYTFIMLLIPFVCTTFTLFVMHSMSVVTNEHALPLNLKQIREGIIYIYSPTPQQSHIEQLLFNEIEQYRGIKAQKLLLSAENNISDEMKALQVNNLAYYLQNVIGVIDISRQDSTGSLIFNVLNSGNIYHSSVILINLIDNVIQKSLKPKSNIETTYVPIRRFVTDVSPTRLEYYAVIVSIGMFFTMFYYVSLPFREHASGFKDLQAIPKHIYWICTFIIDLILHFIVCLALYGVQNAVMPKELYNSEEQIIIIASIFFYGCSYLPILYCFANSFKSISTISTYLLFMLIISAIVPLITSTSMSTIKYHEVKILFLSLLPDFNLNHQLRVLNENFIISRRNAVNSMAGYHTAHKNMVTAAQNELNVTNFFVTSLLVTFVSMIFLIFFLEQKYKRQNLNEIFSCRSCCPAGKKRTYGGSNGINEEDECNCKQEKENVQSILRTKSEYGYPLIVSNLQKKYKRKLAVRDLSFAVKRSECFGLLGVNGAGKTSTFQMITSNITISNGNIKIDGIDIHEQEVLYNYRFGYCPQHDALNNFMTSKQILKYMAILRGLRSHHLTNEIRYWLEKLDIEKYEGIQIKHYSGGTKRKLLAALAMIGSPSLVLLDEPTTGVDPVSRRFLWKCIQDFQKRDKTVVLTSHSMDECEQLCNRLAIMAGGKLKCIGGICELKLRYGSGFTIKVKLKEDAYNWDEYDIDPITEEMLLHFPESELREHHAGILTYFIQNTNHIVWSNVFKRTEQFLYNVNIKTSNIVEDYSVNESTLEDIFLKFDPKNSRQNNLVRDTHVVDV